MSDERPRFAHWRYVLPDEILIVEFFQAKHFHHKARPGKPVYPSPHDVGSVDWSKMYRVRIRGKWFGPKSYSFFTMVQMAEIVERILERGSVLQIRGY